MTRQRIQDHVIGAMAMAVVVAIMTLIVVRIPVAPRNSPIVYEDVDYGDLSHVCPGDVIPYRVRVHVDYPTVFTIYSSIVRMDTGVTINGTEQQLPPRPRSVAREIEDHRQFTIPDLPPGDYERLSAAISVNIPSEPAFLHIPFVVSSDCPQK